MTSIPSCGAHIIDLQVVVSLHLRTTPWRTQKRAAPEEGIETAEAHMLNIPYAYLNLPYLTLPYLGRLPIGRTFLCLSEDSPGLSVCLPPLYETQLLPLARAARPRATLWLLAEPMGLNTKPLPSCVVNRLERKFQALIVAVFATDGLLLPGSIVDAGANDGGEACFLASLAPGRFVHALEPLAFHLNNVLNVSSSRPNIRPMLGALGSVERTVSVRQSPHNGHHTQLSMIHTAPSWNSSGANDLFNVYRIDSLFTREWVGERFAFGHFDLEGAELDALQGGEKMIHRDRPLFSLEVGLKIKTNDALEALRALRYRGYVVPEQCGFTSSCRNVMCFPIERLPPPALINRSLLLPLP